MAYMLVTAARVPAIEGLVEGLAPLNLASERATRGASVSVSASGRASARRARSVPTCKTCPSPNSCSSMLLAPGVVTERGLVSQVSVDSCSWLKY
jgi:hypothetical protein